MRAESNIRHQIGVEPALGPRERERAEPGRGWDASIAELAERQHGVVSRRQLLELGLGRQAIARRREAKRLHDVHRGVYAVGYRRLTRLGGWMAAVLACGPGALLSHRPAGVLLGMLDSCPDRVEVTAPRRLAGRDGIRARQASVALDEQTVVAGIPVTTPARTLLDLAAVLDPHRLARALERAEALRLTSETSLHALLERHAGRPGAACLRRMLAELVPQHTRSELERRFLTFVEKAGLPRPRTNVWLQLGEDWIEVDAVWSDRRLVVELDSRAHHLTREAFERDRERDRRLQAAGWRVARLTDRALRAPGTSDELRALLSRPVALGRSA
jgi:predicted transcriptional regulator of viral defense system